MRPMFAVLLLALMGPWAALPVQATDGESLVVEDAANDVHAAPDVDLSGSEYADLIRMEVKDDEADILIELEVSALRVGTPNQAEDYSQLVIGGYVEYYAYFTFASQEYRIRAYASLYYPAAEPGTPHLFFGQGEACRIESNAACGGSRHLFTASTAAATNSILLRFPKDVLRSEPPVPFGRSSPLTEVWAAASAWRSAALFGQVRQNDRMPDDGTAGPFQTGHPALNWNLELSLPTTNGRLHVNADSPNSLDLNVSSRVSEKRIVRLEGGVAPQDPNATFVTVAVPSGVTLPGQQHRIVRITVNVSKDAPEGALIRLVFRAESVAFPDDVAMLTTTLRVSRTLTPESPTVYVHAQRTRYGDFGEADCSVREAADLHLCQIPIASLTGSDPLAPDRNEFRLGTVAGTVVLSASLRDRLGGPVALDLTKPVEVQLALNGRSDLPAAEAQAHLSFSTPTQPSLVIAEGRRSIDLDASWSTIRMELKFKRDAPDVVPRHSSLMLIVTIPVPDDATRWHTGKIPHGKGAETFATLPVIELPPELRAQAPSAFQLQSLDENDRFINPGKTLAFRASLLNQGQDPQRARVRLEDVPAGWTATLAPGDRFFLHPGDTISLLASLRAPDAVPDGTVTRFNLTVFDELDRPARLRFVVTALAQVDVPDESGKYEVDRDAVERLETQAPAKTPGPSGVWLLLALALGSALCGRRPPRGASRHPYI